MAIYHFHLKKSSKSKSMSGKGFKHAQYILREGEYGNNGKNHEEYILREGSFDKKNDLEYKEHGNIPDFVKNDPIKFWKSAEKFERKNGVVYREFEIALPVEFTREQNIKLVKEFVEKELGRDYAYTFAIHKPKSSTKQGLDQPHTHIMFCDRKLDGIERTEKEFFRRYNSKNPELGGARKDIEWQTKEKLLDLRKDWALILNSHLEKNSIYQKVSSETLQKQREQYLIAGNKLEADRLDREVINIDGRILYKKEEDLTDYERKLKEDFYEKIKMKEIKEKIYETEKLKVHFSEENPDKELEEKNILELERDKAELVKQIEKLQLSSDYENLKKTAINQLTSRRLYNLLNENKRIDKKNKNLKRDLQNSKDVLEKEILSNKIQSLNIKKDIILKEYKEILTSYDIDDQKKNQMIRKMDSIRKSYNEKIIQKRRTLNRIEDILKEKSKLEVIAENPDHIVTTEKIATLMAEYMKKGYKAIHLKKEEIKNNISILMMKEKNIEKMLLNEFSDGEYEKLLIESKKLYMQSEKLELEFNRIPSLKFITKENKRRQYNETVTDFNKTKNEIEKIIRLCKNNKEFSQKKLELEKYYLKKINRESEKLKDLEAVEKLKTEEINKSKTENTKKYSKLAEINNVGVNFHLKKRHYDEEEKEEELER
ncbi:MAG: MobA/MobL family protein [Sebaldella sp.]|nr:MobA/MobL family protein [Sebaldella sp.]